jgi:hypothetical protein
MNNKEAAIDMFERTFENKTGNSWQQRADPPKAGLYTVIEMPTDEQ